jgi:predicted Zn-dependent protease
MQLERLHESLVHDRKHNKADEENLVEKDVSSSTTEIRRWFSQMKSTHLSAFSWTKCPFDHSSNWPEDLAFLAAISKVAESVGN